MDQNRWQSCKISISMLLLLLIAGCQLRPVAKGLPTFTQLQQYNIQNRQDQVDIKWRDQSFAFLLYQQQQQDHLHVLALSLTGQVLFELHYDGDQVNVIQRIDAMKYLPFDFVLRDILWATLPASMVQQQVQTLGLNLTQTVGQHGQIQREIGTTNKVQLKILQQNGNIQINNLNVPYQMTITAADQQFFQPE
ncbi:DUF3261 domain-containing protein [Acinetobacter puyangensis]|uniref:DUF3261 domain-containing protein n=1 Tax=Acinetobacter puyangensis TaxID=1096779 RepID=A0A240E3A1_9GAMM|nr:DUF3261 domain-containing protein [Acinetobacter puyangensis]SNX43247.1 Protein of unknown function [Acinetobacter puyangensis]